MIDKERRRFLRHSTAFIATGALAACGGDTAPAGNTSPLPPPAPPNAPPNTPPNAPQPPATPLTDGQFTLTNVRAAALLPFCLGFAFRQGAVPRGKTVAGDTTSLQVAIKNRWPDGSAKFAILSGVADGAAAATRMTVKLAVMPEGAGAAGLDTGRLRAVGLIADVGCGSYGAAHWEGADWDQPFHVWVSGPAMSSWIYRKQAETDPHVVAWLELRLWKNGAIEILPWVENGYLRVANPSNKAGRYHFSINGQERMAAEVDLKHHQRFPLISGTALSYWVDGTSDAVARQNPVDLQSTELVPSYQARLAADSAVIKGLVASFHPLQAGNFNYDQDSMAAPGYQDPIGLLPQHDVAYLVSDADTAYAAVIRNGYSAGRYGIHYRDELTHRPPRFSSYPGLCIGPGQGFKDTGGSTRNQLTPTATGGNPPGWDVAHSPSVGYLAYLVTGRWYFMEQVQFATTADYLGKGHHAVLRDGSKGLVQTTPGAWQTRSCAWEWRARVQALCVTPDDDTALREELIASVEANIDHFHGRYVARANNPFGWIKPGESYANGAGSPWQQDFVTAAFGFSLSLGLPVSAGAALRLKAFFAWKARSAVMRLGPRDKFWYVNAVPYTLSISPGTAPDYDTGAGPWHATDADVYAATYASPPAWLGKEEGKLAAEYMPGERAMWGNLMPAIAYAVRHNVAGAREAYDRIVNAVNWPALRDAFNVRPVWAVQPAGYQPGVPVPPAPPVEKGVPAWLAGQPLNQWIEIAGTAGAGGSAVGAYSGMAFNDATGEILIAAAGGHLDSSDNRVVSLKLNVDAPQWQVRHASSGAVKMDVAYYADGKPVSRHLYSSIHYIPQLERLILFGVIGAYGNAHSFATVDAFDLRNNQWDAAGTWPNTLANGDVGAVLVRDSGDVWTSSLARWSTASKQWSKPITRRTQDLVRAPIAHDPLRKQLFSLNWADGQGFSTPGVFATRVPLAGDTQVSVSFAPGPGLESFIRDKPTYAGMDYDPINDRFLFYCGQGEGAGRIYAITPQTSDVWNMSVLELKSAVRPPATPGAGVHSRFRFVSALKGFVLLPSSTSNLYFFRLAV